MTHTNSLPSTEKAKYIRTALKARGWNSRLVSVRSSAGRLSLEIRDSRIEIGDVETIAMPYDVRHYDHVSGELLCGHMSVSVTYSTEALAERGAAYVDRIAAAVDALSGATFGEVEISELGREIGCVYKDGHDTLARVYGCRPIIVTRGEWVRPLGDVSGTFANDAMERQREDARDAEQA